MYGILYLAPETPLIMSCTGIFCSHRSPLWRLESISQKFVIVWKPLLANPEDESTRRYLTGLFKLGEASDLQLDR